MLIDNLGPYKIPQDATIKDAACCISNNKHGIAVVVSPDDRIVATITDADLRNAALSNCSLDNPIGLLIEAQKALPFETPITSPQGETVENLLHKMEEMGIRHIPIVDANRKFVDLAIMDELLSIEELQAQVLIMAGGFGTRLRPFTNDLPKPMLPLAGRPMLEHIIRRLKFFGFSRIVISTYYQRDKIIGYFGDGKALGVSISYTCEEEPFGTGGALRLLKEQTTTLIINGDILTDLNFKLFLEFHKKNHAAITVGVKQYEVNIPYGVINLDGIRVDQLVEKPKLFYFVNAGIYVIESSVFDRFPKQGFFNMTDVINSLLNSDLKVISFPIYGYWNDVGSPADYERAKNDISRIFT
jgi:dTDP-glucose pyrophosphorylase